MNVYKFQDIVDGRFAFILAKNQGEATKTLQNLTIIGFKFIESKTLKEINMPIVLINKILPF
jgi:hypothetical protein